MAKQWHLLPHHPAAISQLARSLNVSPVVAQVLLNRGLRTPESARNFLDAPLNDLHPPAALPGAAEAAERIYQAVQQGKRVCVYGDYDVDGITGTSILWQALRLLNATADYYLPHRLDEGYGLNGKALRTIADSGAALVVTVDCGIAGVDEADEARRLGLELIITDHHEPKDKLPDASVIVHPRVPRAPGADAPRLAPSELSGAGVAFKVAWALCQRACGSEKVTPVFREFLLDGVALAALGLVADVVPLTGENRVFVRHGLARLGKKRSPGLEALLETSGLAAKAPLLADDISYKLAPRLNAAGRLGPARLVVELLTTSSAERALELARHLEVNNQQRQQLERRTLAEAKQRVEADGLAQAPALVLESSDWHPGIIGIVAGRLADQFGRPALLIALPCLEPRVQALAPDVESRSVVGHGSARSIPGLPLHETLQECSDLLIGHGGHAAAAGFRISPHLIDTFRQRICASVARRFDAGLPPPAYVIDAEVPLAALTFDMVRDLDRLEPFGSDNRRPLFLSGALQVVGSPALVGAGNRHLNFKVRQETTILRAIAFSLGERVEELMSERGQCCLVFTPRMSVWNGVRRVELEVVDFQPGPRARLT